MTTAATAKPGFSPVSTPLPPRYERLTGEPITDHEGHVVQPSEADPLVWQRFLPTMLVDKELNYLHWLAANLRGAGRVVELGCFLGGSTVALAKGMAANPDARGPILTYDAFETPGEQHEQGWLTRYGLRPGQRFRERFDKVVAQFENRILVRERRLPEYASDAQRRQLYPEQEAVELLFVDIAKSWGVHMTALMTFGAHLHPGGIVIQQDFLDLRTPWVALHMWQLRHEFEPLDVLFSTPTVSFRCVRSPAESLNHLWTGDEFTSREQRDEAWNGVRDYWRGKLGGDFARVFHGHQAIHALRHGDSEDATKHARAFEAWRSTAGSTRYYTCPGWIELIESIPTTQRSTGNGSRELDLFAAECIVRNAGVPSAPYLTDPDRIQAWRKLGRILAAEGHKRVALFGGGRHTAWLLSQPDLLGLPIDCIIDEHPHTDSIEGIPVRTPAQADPHLASVTAILPSSDAYESSIFDRMQVIFGELQGLRLYRVYTLGNRPPDRGDPTTYTLSPDDASDIPPRDLPMPPGLINQTEHRPILGLKSRRRWADTLHAQYRIPGWVTGYVAETEMAFLWDMIELTRPTSIVEIGTASGVSTAMLLAAAEALCPPDTLVHSFDIATRCYFDADRPLGGAIPAMVPRLLGRARLHAKANANDAAASFSEGGIEFAFIDGNHAHPAPSVDMLALLYALKPCAWVVLHDIELGRMKTGDGSRPWAGASGAQQLYDRWPFEKVRLEAEDPADRNIGAIRMPQRVADAAEHLVGMLDEPFEMAGPLLDQIARARRAMGHAEHD